MFRKIYPRLRGLLLATGMVLSIGLVPSRIPARAETEAELKLGVVIPLSGPTATYGLDCLAGLNLVIDQINLKGGIKNHKLALEVRDNQGDPFCTAQEVKALAAGDALAIIGPVTSNNALAAATVAQSEGIPLLTPYATYAPVTEVGDYISRICFIDLQQAEAMASYAYSVLGLRQVAILCEYTSHYSQEMGNYFSDRFQHLGGRIVAHETFRSPQKDAPQLLLKIKALKPDAIFIPVYYTDAAGLAKEAAHLKASSTLLGGDGWESSSFFQLAGDTLTDQKIYITSHFSSEDSRATVRNFVALFRQKHGRDPNSLAALAYDAGLVIADALSRTPQLSRSALKEAINSTYQVDGVTGVITLNEKRDPRKEAYILEACDGSFHLRSRGLKPE